MKSEVDVQNYTYSLGNMAFTNPPAALKIADFSATSKSSRVLADYNFLIQPYSGSLSGNSIITCQWPENFKL